MSHKWSNSVVDNGILRKHDTNEKKDDILVFGYSCKLFRDDEKALYIDQGKHLIPWMGDDSLKIDRYDCRGNMSHADLSLAEAKVDGVNWFQLLSSEEQRAEKLCDEERYRALYTNEDEEEMYREEELKRLHSKAKGSSYGQVQFNYEGDSSEDREGGGGGERGGEGGGGAQGQEADKDDEPFVPSPHLAVPEGMPLPETKKLNAIIEKTAMFIVTQGGQMEVLLKAKQAGNPQFDFLCLDCPLHHYYAFLLQAIREGRYQPHQETKPQEKPEEDEHYLHPSLAPVSVESAPSIPSIAYKPSADCAYSMLVNQIKGKDPNKNGNANQGSVGSVETDIAPPGTEVLPLPLPNTQEDQNSFSKMTAEQLRTYASYSFGYYNAEIAKGPVMYNKDGGDVSSGPSTTDKTADGFDSNVSSPRSGSVVKSGPLKLIHYSDSDSDSDSAMSSFHNRPLIIQPPPDQQLIIDKMASYVAKNGDTFEQIVMMKGDTRFSFLNPSHEYHLYYKNKRQFYERANKKEETGSQEGADGENKSKGPVSFSIKKIKEPEPILPKPALPYESTSDEGGSDNENSRDSTKAKEETKEQQVTTNNKTSEEQLNLQSNNVAPEPVKLDVNIINKPLIVASAPVSIPTVPTSKPVQIVPKPVPAAIVPKPVPIIQPMPFLAKTSMVKTVPSNVPVVLDAKTIYRVQNDVQPIEKRIVIDNINVPVVSKNSNERKRSRSNDRKVKRDRSPRSDRGSSDEDSRERRRRRKRRYSRSPKRRVCEDVITLEDDDVSEKGNFIDLTEDDRGYKREVRERDKTEEGDWDECERKRKAAAFLSTLKDIPKLATQPQSSLASAMVKTLHSYHSKKREEESHRRRKSKKHKRGRSRSYSSDSDGDDRYSRHHHRSRHSKKSKKSSRDDRSSKSGSRSHRSSPRDEYDVKSKDKHSSHGSGKSKTSEQGDYKPKKQNDKLLTTSLKELVKETRKELIASEPIKMAVDIFSDKPMQRNDWEQKSNKSSRDGNESGELSTTSTSSSTSSDED